MVNTLMMLVTFSFKDLKDYMRKAGEVTYADAHKERRNEGCVYLILIDFRTILIGASRLLTGSP